MKKRPNRKQPRIQGQQELFKRSVAAKFLGISPRTMARYERSGIITGIKRNSRSTFYRRCDLEKLTFAA